jgi:hypothetical protein
MNEIIVILSQVIVIGFQVMLIVGIISVASIVISAVVRILKSKAWGGDDV